MLSSLLFTLSLFKHFSLLAKQKDFDFFKATLSTLNIIYINIIYNIYILYTEKAHLGLHSDNETAVLKTKKYLEKFIEELDFAESSIKVA